MGDHNVFVVELLDQADELVDVHVPSGIGAFGVIVDEEGTLGYQYLAFGDVVECGKVDVTCIAEVGCNGDLHLVVDRNSLFFQLDKLRSGQFEIFGFELLSLFDNGIADRSSAVLGWKHSDEEIGLDRVFVAGLYTDELAGDVVAVEPAPCLHDLLDRLEQVFRKQYRPRRLAAEFAMRQIISDPSRMVHVPVGQQHVIDGYNLVGSLANIEADVKLGHTDDGLLAGDGVAQNVKIVYFNTR